MTKIMKETKRNNYDKIMNRVGIHTLSGYDVIKLDGIKGWNRAVNLFCLIKMTLLDKLAEQYNI